MNWVERIKTEKETALKLYGEFKKRPIKIYPITEDKKYVLTKNDSYKNCLKETTIQNLLKIILKSNCIHNRYINIVPYFGYGIPEFNSLVSLSKKLDEIGITELLSLGAGNGFYELLLCNYNRKLSIESSDIVPPDLRHYPIINYTGIEHIENTKLKNFSLIFVWPPGEKWVPETIEKYRNTCIKNKIIILIGSVYEYGGCMSDSLETELKNWCILDDDIYYTNFDETEVIKIFKHK